MTGLEENGKIKCECRGGFEQVGNTDPIVCKSLDICKPNQRIKGRKGNGSPLCVDQIVKCNEITFGDDDATCPIGGWLEAIDLGVCRPGPSSKKGGASREVKCERNRGTCCYFKES